MFTAKIERNLFDDDDVYIIEDPVIKSEYVEESKVVPLAEQEMTVSQSNTNDNFEDLSHDVATIDMAVNKTPEPDPDVMKFYCTYCQDANFQTDAYNSVQEVHNHWHTKHTNLPFQFYAGYSSICHVCKEHIQLSEIKNHFKVFHPMQPIAVANRLDNNKCAICEYIGDNLTDHFLAHHQIVINANLFNPMQLTKEDIRHLSGIEVHKKYKCKGCKQGKIETQSQSIDHLRCSYANGALDEFYDKHLPYFECGLCGCKVEQTQLFSHFSKDHDFECWNCDLVEGNLDALIVHHNEVHNGMSMEKTQIELGKAYFQTKIIFCNGLILNKANIMSVGDNEYDIIKAFFQSKSSTPLSIETISTATSIESNTNAQLEPRSDADLTEEEKQIYLESQQKLLSSIVVFGLIVAGNDNEIRDAFLKLCKYIKISIDSNDIDYIKRLSPTAIAVKFRERPKKELLLNATAYLKGLKSDAFLQLPPGRKPIAIYVNPRLNKHYMQISQKARAHLQMKRIQSFRIGSQGCSVKMTKGGKEHHVRSIKELDDLVEGKITYQRKRKYNELPQTNSPKRNKCA